MDDEVRVIFSWNLEGKNQLGKEAQIVVDANQAPVKKGKGRKALKPKNSSNEANIIAGNAASSPLVPSGDILKHQETISFPLVQSLREKENEKKKKANPENKKPSTAYILWCKDQWNEVKKENPEADFKEISNILGAKWKTLKKRENEAMKLFEEEQKQKTAMELLEQYLQFKQEVDKENMDKENKKKKEKDPLKPKQPLSAFFLYSKERRATLLEENKNVLEIAKIAGEEWKNLTEKQRKPYEKIAKKQKEEYLQEMEVYKQKKAEEAASRQQEEEELMKIQKLEAMQLLKRKEKTDNILKKTKEQCQKKKKEEQNVDPNKPKRPASSYILFRQERPGINNSTLSALISVKWKELNEADKKIWNDKAAEAMEAYKKELEEYNKSAVAPSQ
ncbi:hypothetical protein Syun_013341 [Stephania yunnanensis]|uniref:HMG box domain-containing protein n=1 Tax=Stephania yunnanensis TaxID=152371 RepID=A0AAP0K173_9MAGN